MFHWNFDTDSDRGEKTGEVPELQAQLQELYGRVLQLIEEGDEETSRELIEANYEVVAEQLESGYKCIEQIAMLDILAQLRMSLGEFEEAECLLDQVLCSPWFLPCKVGNQKIFRSQKGNHVLNTLLLTLNS